jgi:two-component system nitrate/nitrite sensor histidine kinase NarX
VSRKIEGEKRPPRIAVLRWELLAIVVVMLLILAVVAVPGGGVAFQPAQLIVYGSLLLLAGFLLYISLFRWRTLERRLSITEADLAQTKRRLAELIHFGQELSLAETEDEAIGQALDACRTITPAAGVTYLPIDDRGHARALIWRGDLPRTWLENLADQLALPSSRSVCSRCTGENPALHTGCSLPIVKPAGMEEIYSLSVRRGDRELGLVNLFLGPGQLLDQAGETFLTAVMDELTLLIEGIRARQHDLSMRLEVGDSDVSKISPALQMVAEAYYKLSKADFLILSMEGLPDLSSPAALSVGSIPPEAEARALDLLSSARLGADPMRDVVQAGPNNLGQTAPGLIATPLRNSSGEAFGGLVMGWGFGNPASPPELSEVCAAAEGLALVADFPARIQEIEFKSVLSERNRLAREIHDGLAQNLGYLKLLGARMAAYLGSGDLDSLRATLNDSREALGDAYDDARGAIDNLVLSPGFGLAAWMDQLRADFEGSTGIPVNVTGIFPVTEPPLEIQAQMVRILQEALTNVRKHADAQNVWIESQARNGELTIEVRDDGRGFQPEALLNSSQHGLLSMQERAELIGGKLQIVSSGGEGTIVRLRMVLRVPESET